jgi:hypothetical protein
LKGKSKDKKESKKPSGDTSQLKNNDIAKNLGPDGKLLPSIHQHCIDNKLYLLCGKPGHIATNCFKKKNKDTASGRAAKPATGTSEAKDASGESKN